MSLKLEIVTPEKSVFSDDVDSTVIPGVAGELGILPQHAPLITTLQPGELSYQKGNETHYLAIGEGFVEVTQETVSVMTDMAMGEGEIDEDAVEKALERAKAALEEKTTDEEVAAVEASILKSIAQLNVKRRRRRL